MINVNDLEDIIKIVEKHNISEFEFTQENSKVVIKKGNSKECIQSNDLKSINVINEEEHPKEEMKPDEKVDYIKASLAGTLYLKKEENAEPFIKINDTVTEDTVIGLIEVMKLFNEVEAGIEGEIIEILVKDKDFVEYGQPLFKVKLKG